MQEQEKVVDEVIEEKTEETDEGTIEITVSISSNGRFKVDATEGVHPMFLVGLLQYAVNSFIQENRSGQDE